MGIDHPCGGVIYSKRIHASPATIRLADHMHVVMECELAVRVARTFEPRATPYTRDEVRAAVVGSDAGLRADRGSQGRLQIVEGLFAHLRQRLECGDRARRAGESRAGLDLNGIQGRLQTGSGEHTGKTDDPMGALAWIANLAASRGLPLAAGQVVITGSLIPTLPIAEGETFSFAIDGIGTVRATGV